MDKRIVEIADHYGYDAQSRQLIEEMSELTGAVNKFWRKVLKCGSVEFTSDEAFRDRAAATREMNDLIQEFADVEVCMEQMRYMLDADEAIEAAKEDKIRRQMYRMKRGE